MRPAISKDFTLEEFRSNGLLWLINSTVFHPRGFALAVVYDKESPDDHQDAKIIGLRLMGDGKEPWAYSDKMYDEATGSFDSVNQLFDSLQNRI